MDITTDRGFTITAGKTWLEIQNDKRVRYTMLDGWDQNFSDLALPNQWVNSSYHNDSCPSFAFKGWQIWIDAEILEDRQSVWDGFSGVENSRFTIMEVNNYSHSNTCELFENFQDVLDFVNKKIAPFIGRMKRTTENS